MSGPAIVGLGLVIVAGSCNALNGDYDGGMTGTGSSGTTLSASSGGDGPAASTSTTAGSSSGSPQSSGPNPECGNGVVEGDEGCDLGDEVDEGVCTDDCRIPGEPEWETDFETRFSGSHRFSALAIFEGDVIAVGRAVLQPGMPRSPVIVRFDREDGQVASVGVLPGPTGEGEAFSIAAAPNRVFVAGSWRPEGTYSGFVACLEPGAGDVPTEVCWVQGDIAGQISHAVGWEAGQLLATTGRFNAEGYGIVELNDDDGVVLTEWLDPAPMDSGQFEAIAWTDDGPVVGGMVDADAIVGEVQLATQEVSPWLVLPVSSRGRDIVQGLWSLGDAVAAGGWSAGSNNGPRQAFVGIYEMSGFTSWERTFQGGGASSDEVEAVTVDEAGHVIAVGMLGEPAVPAIWKLEVSTGETVWERQYPELAEDDTFFRGVVVDHDIFVAGERRLLGEGSQGIVLRLAP